MQTVTAPTPPAAAPGFVASAVQSAAWYAAALATFFLGWGAVLLYVFGGKRLGLLAPGEKPSYLYMGLFLAASLVAFLLLERKFVLHRLAGYAPAPDASPTVAGLLLWAGGVPYLTARHNLAAARPAEKPKPGPHHPGRETLETFVFVVVLVLLLKSFVVEAFVIPTGSMAESLLGYNQVVTCEECGYEFPLNSTCEVEPTNGPIRPVEGYCCPNCRFKSLFQTRRDPDPSAADPAVLKPRSLRVGNASGDRLLVHKAMPEIRPYQPGDIVVFKFPPEPQKNYTSQNYIKRMWGVGGDTVAIWKGDLYACKTLPGPPQYSDQPFASSYPWPTDDVARAKFEESRKAGFPAGAGGFELIRKNDDVALDMKRVVWDNDFQSNYLARKSAPPRWKAQTDDWTPTDNGKGFAHTGPNVGWVRYRHVPVLDWAGLGGPTPSYPDARPVDNFLGYNAEVGPGGGFRQDMGHEDYRFWVGDLLMECRAKFADADAEVTLELSKGPNRFQATFGKGKLKLARTGKGGTDLGEFPVGVAGPGTYELRFANVDSRLRVWIDGRRIELGAAADYAPTAPDEFDPADTKREGWTTANDVREPAGIAAAGGVEVNRIKLARDTFFIGDGYNRTTDASASVLTFYVRPEHVLCLGDNSAASSDGRTWGVVPERLMLGKAVFVFFPLDRIGIMK